MASSSVVIVAAELEIQNGLASYLAECDLTIVFASTLGQTQSILRNDRVSVIVCPEELPDGSFDDILGLSKRAARRIPVIVFSPFADWPGYLKFVGAGAFDYVRYPSARGEIQRVVRNAMSGYPKEQVLSPSAAEAF